MIESCRNVPVTVQLPYIFTAPKKMAAGFIGNHPEWTGPGEIGEISSSDTRIIENMRYFTEYTLGEQFPDIAND